MGLVGFAGHIYLNAPDHYFGLWGSSDWYRDLLAVTGACQMMRREVFNQVGGYDPGFKLAFGDIDFCLRVHQMGYHNIYTPFARLYHYEGRSRGYVTPIQDILRGYEHFKTYLSQDDPYYSPNLTYSRIPKCTAAQEPLEERQRQIEIRRSFYLKQE
jgi:GT2 family glycosyltransferase